MADGQTGMGFDHPRSAVAHHGADMLAHVRFVAMDAAIGTEGFFLHEGALVAALVCIGDQRGTGGAWLFS